jgi:hypothetical protein
MSTTFPSLAGPRSLERLRLSPTELDQAFFAATERVSEHNRKCLEALGELPAIRADLRAALSESQSNAPSGGSDV